MSDNESGDVELIAPGESRRRRLGPHTIPRIKCNRCGTEHHPDACNGEFVGDCRECSAFLRRPTEAERRKFTDFIVWKSRHMDTGSERGGGDE